MNPIVIGPYRQYRNAKCVHCGHIGFDTSFPDEPVRHPNVCCHCANAGRTMPTATGDSFSPNTSVTTTVENFSPKGISWGGRVVDAPGFTADQFERAMVRAFCDDLQVKATSKHGEYVVHHAGHTSGYRVSRERCTCKAGEVGTPCKHRAALIAHLDIREPHVDREWRKLMADRPVQASA